MSVTQVLAVVVSAAVLVLVYTLMWHGWRRRGGTQAYLPGLPEQPDDHGTPLLPPVEGVYVASTTADRWLEKVVVHGLGTRAPATMTVTTAGVGWWRRGAPDVFVPADKVRGADRATGLGGTVKERAGLVVVTWELGGHALDTGFRPRRAEDAEPLVGAVRQLVHGGGGS